MSQIKKFQETLALYRRHEWRLARVLMCAATRAEWRVENTNHENPSFENVPAEEASFDAMWFARASQGGREAWELRLVADAAYALFELFEPDEAEEDRADVRREMEARMREYAAPES